MNTEEEKTKSQMTVKEAILQSLDDLKELSTHNHIYQNIINKNYYNFVKAKTPKSIISAILSKFIKNDDTRIKRIKGDGNYYLYYLAKHEQNINFENGSKQDNKISIKKTKSKQSYNERDLHKLLSTYLDSKNIYSKTIFHEKSTTSKDGHQKWIHPDMIGIEFLNLKSEVNKAFMKVLNKADTFKLTSYEIKKEINSDYELKKCYFQAVSNSSWANYGYLVAFEISDNLKDEMERLNQSFGIGIIKLKSRPYESKILFQAKFKELDFKTIDKICNVNKEYARFIELTENFLTVSDIYYKLVKKEFKEFCDEYFINELEAKDYCKYKNIPDE
jgi:hypothetical protein